MVRYSRKMKLYAKELFFKTKEDGDHKFLNREIVEEIKLMFPKAKQYPNESTVYRWANNLKGEEQTWNDLFIEGQRAGRKDAIVEAADVIDESNESEELAAAMAQQPELEVLPEEQVRRQAGRILALRASTAISGYNIQQAYLQAIEAEINQMREELAAKDEILTPQMIEDLINTKKSNGLIRVWNQSETTLNNLNIEVIEQEKSKNNEQAKKEMEGLVDVFRDVAYYKLSKE